MAVIIHLQILNANLRNCTVLYNTIIKCSICLHVKDADGLSKNSDLWVVPRFYSSSWPKKVRTISFKKSLNYELVLIVLFELKCSFGTKLFFLTKKFF